MDMDAPRDTSPNCEKPTLLESPYCPIGKKASAPIVRGLLNGSTELAQVRGTLPDQDSDRPESPDSPGSGNEKQGGLTAINSRYVDRRQCKTKVLMRLGTSPAGITAMDLSVFVSIADTERAAELET
jgi:hypothetical protein